MHKIKVLELYCGIGGLHYSLFQAFINFVHTNKPKEKNDTVKEPHEINKKNDICNLQNKCDTYKDDIHNDIKNYKSIEIHKYHDCTLTCLNDLFCFISVDLNPIANHTYFHNFKDSTILLTEARDINKFFKSKCDSVDKQNNASTDSEKKKIKKKINKKKKKNNNNNNNNNNNDDDNIFNINKNYIIQTDINNIMPEFLNNHHFNILLISNPCQPYTRQNKKFKEINLDLLFFNKKVCKENINNNICNDNHNFYINDNQNDQFNINNINIDELNNYLYNDKDERTKSFIHICTLLTKVDFKNLPEFIFIENVKNFELSSSFLYFIYCIKNNYSFQTYLLSPLQFGIPNERFRFYCICKKNNYDYKHTNNLLRQNYMKDQNINLYTNSLIPKNYLHKNNIQEEKKKQSHYYNNINSDNIIFYTPHLITYLDVNNNFNITNNIWNHINIYNNYLDTYQVQNKILLKNASYCFDIININKKTTTCCHVANYHHHQKKQNGNNISNDQQNNYMDAKRNYAMCFTSNYGRYIKGSGSILYYNRKNYTNEGEEKTKKKQTNVSTKENKENVNTFNYISNPISPSHNDTYQMHKKKNSMKKYENNVRYFTPTEISRLMGFKMKTNNININQNENEKKKKNTYGNIFWNIDHINHTCAYYSNKHYCDVLNKNACLLTYKNHTNINNHSYQNYHKNNCLCHQFVFPNFLTDRQKYKLIGNSVNVIVISYIFHVHNIFDHI
ncbi:DNA (cytosine-5)-methyltransferase [Plasmodium gaboni]|uniref:DNA (Cytosine-5)-methyltransferase n=1 Tax=Plasmodium gaboni TaxID=647221 RepID=A0ABY1ULP6_9APIC|nr:DNA (cytosine-5)-methyltransferase [Plasmodium gaboni]